MLTSIKMVKRPPNSTIWDVSEQRSHISPVEAPESISSKNLCDDVPGLAKHPLGHAILNLGLKLEAGGVPHLALHHQLLGDHVYWHSDALRHEGGRATSHQ